MKKKILIYLSIAFINLFFAKAQLSLPQILLEVESNNKTLKAASQQSQVQKIEAKTGLYLPDPMIDYDQLFGNSETNNARLRGIKLIQAFDFPSSYLHKNKISDLKYTKADLEYNIVRQDILLEVKLLCVELVFYNKQRSILKYRLYNAKKLNESYKKRLNVGDANVLETNKIGLELLNMETKTRLNDVEIANRIQKLTQLNGGIPISFTDTIYFQEKEIINLTTIVHQTLESNPDLKSLQQNKIIASKEVSLAKSLSLPKFTMGYRMEIESPGKLYGFTAGMTIPLWENKNTVKRAKAQLILSDLEIDNTRLIRENELKQLYEKVIVLQKLNEEYQSLLTTQNTGLLLDKALSVGQISLLEYLTEINFLYESIENYLQTERDYHIAMSELLKVSL